MPLIDVNGYEHTVSQKHAINALIFGWALFLMGVLCNVAYYKVVLGNTLSELNSTLSLFRSTLLQ